MTPKQTKDIDCIKYFIPPKLKEVEITQQDIDDFLAFSDKGIKTREYSSQLNSKDIDGYGALMEGKRWRGIHMQMWEEGVLEGTVPYITLLEGREIRRNWFMWLIGFKYKQELLPKYVVDFMSKEMFKGIDKEIIMERYNDLKQEC